MKNAKVVAIVVLTTLIMFTFTSADGKVESTRGKLNYSGGKIPAKYNGKWIMAVAIDTAGSKTALFAAASVAKNGTINGAKISGGNAALQVWKSSDGDLVNFNGSGNYILMAYVMNKASMTKEDWEKINTAMQTNPLNFATSNFSAADVMGTVTFSSGTGAANIGMFIDFQ